MPMHGINDAGVPDADSTAYSFAHARTPFTDQFHETITSQHLFAHHAVLPPVTLLPVERIPIPAEQLQQLAGSPGCVESWSRQDFRNRTSLRWHIEPDIAPREQILFEWAKKGMGFIINISTDGVDKSVDS